MNSSAKPKPTYGELRRTAAALLKAGRDYAEIGEALKINSIRARDLCHQYDEIARKYSADSHWMDLSKVAMRTLLNCRRAELFGATEKERAYNLPQIAMAYKRSELRSEHGVAQSTCNEIFIWLQTKGLAFIPEYGPVVLPRTKRSKMPRTKTARRLRAKQRGLRSMDLAVALANGAVPRRKRLQS